MTPAASCKVPAFRLPGGGDAVLRPLRGSEEEWVASLPPDLPEPEFITALLSRSVRSLNGERARPDRIRQLTPGDRDFLLLQVARVTFGQMVELSLTCPRANCGARMHAGFDIERVPIESRPVQDSYSLRLPDGRDLVFRLPVGADQEAAARWSGLPHEEKRARFLARCVLDGSALPADDTSRYLSDAIYSAAPQVDLDFSAICPECGHESSHRFEPARWFISELRRRWPQFEREVHLLSLHYHWPLREVLSMTRARRARWASLLTREMEPSLAGGASRA